MNIFHLFVGWVVKMELLANYKKFSKAAYTHTCILYSTTDMQDIVALEQKPQFTQTNKVFTP